MEESVKCPICHEEYDAGTQYCPNCLCPMESLKGSWDTDEEERVDDAANLEDVLAEQRSGSGQVQCPECGYSGSAGGVCAQCGHVLGESAQGNVENDGACAEASGICANRDARHLETSCPSCNVSVSLPNGRVVQIGAGSTLVIGRESDNAQVAHELQSFNVVSRRHCRIDFDAYGRSAQIFDLGSTNGTWVEGRSERLRAGEGIVVTMPVRIRLGQRLYLGLG